MAHIAYVRVSTTDQNTERQLAEVEVSITKKFVDKCSGGSVQRPALSELKEYIREGDTVHSIDRLARNLSDLKDLVTDWNNNGINVKFHKEGLCFKAGGSDPMSELMLSVLGAVAQFELPMI